MGLAALDNLVKIGRLKAEPPGEDEVARMLKVAFQCLAHTVQWEAARWRVLDLAHQKRNLAEYEGSLDVEESTSTSAPPS